MHQKTLNLRDLILFIFCAMFGVEAIASTAAIGPSAISWWVICTLGFFLPLGFIAAELGSTYPEQGGVYVWAKRALGKKWAARITWYYWIALPLWMPAIFISILEIFKHALSLEIALWEEVFFCIILIWLTVGINLFSLKVSKWIPNIGALARFLVIIGIITAGVIFFVKNNNFANDIEISDLWPNLNSAIIFIPMVIYNLVGFELVGGTAGEIKNPQRNIPKAIIFSAILILSVYLLVTLAMWTVIPIHEIDVTKGIFDIFIRTFSASGTGQILTIILGLFIMFTLFSEVVTWTLADNRIVAEAAKNNELPKTLGRINKKGVPISASVVSGCISSLIILIYGFVAQSAGALFWNILAFSAVISLCSYLILFPVYIILRKKDANIKRPYQVPGPNWLKITIAIIAEIFVALTAVVLIVQPGEDFYTEALPVIIGVIITIIIGEILISYSMKKDRGKLIENK